MLAGCHRLVASVIGVTLAVPALSASTIKIQLPDGIKIKSATATARAMKLDVAGTIDGRTVVFANVLPDTPYDARITLEDGTILQGVDMGWYNDEAVGSDVGPLDDDDKKQIKELFDSIKAFENKRTMLLMNGNHDRVTILAELLRDDAFYGRKGDEVIWRVELWYFKNQHGGWEKVSQQNKVLRRERFARQQFLKETAKLKWVAELGGVRVGKDQTRTASVPLPR